jgi:hypothetical protein
VVSIFGSGLARSTHALADSDLVKCEASAGLCLPVELNFVRVYVKGTPAPMLYVSDGQINFLIPANLVAGPASIQVLSGIYGPEVTVTLVDAAPALFPMTGGYAIATDATGKLLTADAPAHPNDTVVIGDLRDRAGLHIAESGAGSDSELGLAGIGDGEGGVEWNGAGSGPDQVRGRNAWVGGTLPD